MRGYFVVSTEAGVRVRLPLDDEQLRPVRLAIQTLVQNALRAHAGQIATVDAPPRCKLKGCRRVRWPGSGYCGRHIDGERARKGGAA